MHDKPAIANNVSSNPQRVRVYVGLDQGEAEK